jgi:hypothetical protein
MTDKYRIEYEPKPIPDTGYDWAVVNVDDEEDCHYFGSVEEAFEYIIGLGEGYANI